MASRVAGPSLATRDEASRDAGKRRAMLRIWVLVAVLYFSWEAASYRGLFAFATEWQFDHIGQDLPTFTFGVLTTLAAWPALRLFRRRVDARDDGDAHVVADRAAAVDASRDYLHWLGGFAAALALAAVAALLYSVMLPRLDGPLRNVPVAGPEPQEGPTRLIGDFGYGRIASFSRGILFFRRSELYAPIMTAETKRTSIRYFVEFTPEDRPDIRSSRALTRRGGILVRNDMPGALVRLYRYLGYLPAERYYVLYASAHTVRWPYYMIALQFGLGALVFGGAALLQRRHLGRISREDVATPPETDASSR